MDADVANGIERHQMCNHAGNRYEIKTHYPYQMEEHILYIVEHHPYLENEFSNTMKFNLYIEDIPNRASRILGFLKRNMRHCPMKVKELVF